MKKKLAVVGATGLLGQIMIEKAQKWFDIIPFASKNSEFAHDVKDIFKHDVDYAVFLTPEHVSKKYVPLLENVVCVDNSSAFRLEKNVPLVVDEINGKKVFGSTLVANPNCTTIQLAIVLNCLKKLNIKNVCCTTLQSMSGAGIEGLNDLKNNTTRTVPFPICNNFVPVIGQIDCNGFCQEENKIMLESKKILESDFNVLAQCVRVPIAVCHGISCFVWFEKDFSTNDVVNLLKESPSIEICDFPTPSIAKNTSKVFVGRIKKICDNGLSLFFVADNLLRGAVENALEILLRIEKGE